MSNRILKTVFRQLVPNAGTIIVVALMLFAYRAGAMPDTAPANPNVTPGVISYQGTLTDATGKPINGNTNITFRLYNAPTGGTALWTEVRTGTNSVSVNNGLFNVLLGNLTPIPSTVWNNPTLYLSIQVGSDAAEMTPREMIGAVPLAMTVPDGSIATAKIADGAVKSRKLNPTVQKITAPTSVSLTGNYQTVASTTIAVDVPSRVWLIATCDCQTGGGGLAVGIIRVDGQSPGAGEGIMSGWDSSSGGSRQSVSNSYVFDVSPGSHTIALQISLNGGVGSGTVYSTHTGFSYMIISQ